MTILNEETNEFIKNRIDGEDSWLGAIEDPSRSGVWTWWDGSPWDYSNWGRFQPNDVAISGFDHQDRIMMDSGSELGFWNDMNKDDTNYVENFFCQRDTGKKV